MKVNKLKKNSFLEGSFISSVSIVFVKVLGALYVIPFYKIIGSSGGTLYSYAYNIYSLFLNLSLSGIPIAISKIISEYNSLGYYFSKEKAFNISKKIVFIISLLSFLILFFFSSDFANLIIGNSVTKNTIEDISKVIKYVSLSLLIVPFLSVTKGYVQGHKYMTLSSKSEIIEQIVRIVVILLGSYMTIKVLNKSICKGVCIALLGAFAGGLVGYIYLIYKIKRHKYNFNNISSESINNTLIIKKIFRYSFPLVIISIIANIYNVTDLSLIIRGLSDIGYSGYYSELISSIISTWGSKICIIINSIALGVSINLIPSITSSYIKKDYLAIKSKIVKSLSIIIYLSFPISIFISVNSESLYTLFYGYNVYGSLVLKVLVFASVLSSLHLILNMILQGLNEYKIVYINTFIGFFLNALLDIPLIKLFNHINIYPFYGAILATLIGYIVSISIILIFIIMKYKYKLTSIIKVLHKMLLPLIITLFILLIIKNITPNTHNRLLQIPILLLSFSVGSVTYIFVTYKNSLINFVFGKHIVRRIMCKLNGKFV